MEKRFTLSPPKTPEERMKQEVETKITKYRELNKLAKKGQIVLAGSSLMEFFPVNELMMDCGMDQIVYNRGLGGFTTAQYMEALNDCILDLQPRKLFINIGTNDIGDSYEWKTVLINNYRTILKTVQTALPDCKIYVMAYYPVLDMPEPIRTPNAVLPRTLEAVGEANAAIETLAKEMGTEFLNINDVISDERGYLRSEYAADPIHMLPGAYAKILQALAPYWN